MFDSWLDDGFHFFTFVLAPGDGSEPGADGGLAVFAMHPDKPEPISAITVVPKGKDEAEVTNLIAPGGSYIAPLRGLSGS